MRKWLKRNIGFTLIEVLVVMGLAGIIGTRVVYSITDQYKKARDANRKDDLSFISNVLEDNFNDTACFPGSLLDCDPDHSSEGVLTDLPCDPSRETSYVYVSDGNECSLTYELYTNLESKGDPAIINVGCGYGCGPECLYNYGVASTNTTLTMCPGPTPTPTVTPTSTPTSTPTHTPTHTPTPLPSPTNTPTPTVTPMPIEYVCAPGGGQVGSCLPFDYPNLSECPIIFLGDPTCRGMCADRENQCKTSRGKYKPW